MHHEKRGGGRKKLNLFTIDVYHDNHRENVKWLFYCWKKNENSSIYMRKAYRWEKEITAVVISQYGDFSSVIIFNYSFSMFPFYHKDLESKILFFCIIQVNMTSTVYHRTLQLIGLSPHNNNNLFSSNTEFIFYCPLRCNNEWENAFHTIH